MLWSLLLACGGSPAPEPTPEPAGPGSVSVEAPPAEPPAAADRLDLNSATADQLARIPGMTPRMVHEFEEYRPYASVQQFRKEIGKYVPADRVAGWEPFVYVPIAFDTCDAATLEQLPGVDAQKASALMSGRPYGDRAAFLTALGEQVGAEQAEAGAALVP
ncbi:MAG: helix-hairpin-helix domain-containing protein [Myxococcota bacterium]